MQAVEWNGRWPENDQYPPDGASIRYRDLQTGETRNGIVLSVWCGIEPVIELHGGGRIFPSFNEFEVVE